MFVGYLLLWENLSKQRSVAQYHVRRIFCIQMRNYIINRNYVTSDLRGLMHNLLVCNHSDIVSKVQINMYKSRTTVYVLIINVGKQHFSIRFSLFILYLHIIDTFFKVNGISQFDLSLPQ